MTKDISSIEHSSQTLQISLNCWLRIPPQGFEYQNQSEVVDYKNTTPGELPSGTAKMPLCLLTKNTTSEGQPSLPAKMPLSLLTKNTTSEGLPSGTAEMPLSLLTKNTTSEGHPSWLTVCWLRIIPQKGSRHDSRSHDSQSVDLEYYIQRAPVMTHSLRTKNTASRRLTSWLTTWWLRIPTQKGSCHKHESHRLLTKNTTSGRAPVMTHRLLTKNTTSGGAPVINTSVGWCLFKLNAV